ncbi:MAG: hypothetical protein ABI678_17630 [Kofleriaceae bacterium]
MPPSVEEAIHLVSGSAARGQLMGAGARKRIFGSDDMLTSGPCDVDPVRHAALRRAWDLEAAVAPFRSPLDLADLRAAIAGDEPVVLWGTRSFSDLVWLRWALDGLGRIGAEGPRCWLARPDDDDPRLMVGHFTPDEVRIALAAARAITVDQWREGAELWIQYASPSPLRFDEARRRGSSAFPELTRSAEAHGAWFPRIMEGRLVLSELDEVLLGCVDDSWRTPDALLETLPETRVAQQVWSFDAYFATERLRAWASHGALEREVLADSTPHVRDRFRATGRSRRLNDPSSRWVRIEAEREALDVDPRPYRLGAHAG